MTKVYQVKICQSIPNGWGQSQVPRETTLAAFKTIKAAKDFERDRDRTDFDVGETWINELAVR